MSYLPGTLPAEPGPLSRFLPMFEDGVATRWLQENVPPASWLLDPFGLAPRWALEIARAGYRLLVTVNNPLLFFIHQTLANPPSEAGFTAAIAELASTRKGEERLEIHIRNLYRTSCPNCHRPIQAEGYLWRRGENAPFAVLYSCTHCGNAGEHATEDTDLAILQSLQTTDALHRARALERVTPLDDPHRATVEEALEHYLPRPLYVLSTLTNRLQSISPRHRQALTALLVSIYDLGNNLWSHPAERPRPRQLVTPAQFREHNLWQALEKAPTQWSTHTRPVPCTEWPEMPPETGGLCLFRGRVRDLAQQADLPLFSAAITILPRPNQAFWTLSALWAGWLWGAEAVEPFKVVLARRRYDWAWNTEALRAALRATARLLRPNATVFALLSESEPPALTAALLAAQSAGFTLRELALRTPSDPVQITWERVERRKRSSSPDLQQTRKALQDFLHQRGEPATYLHLHAVALSSLEGQRALNAVLSSGGDTENALKAVHSHIQEALTETCHHWSTHESLESGLWGLKAPLESDSLADRLERYLVQFLQRHPQTTFLEIEDALYPRFSGLQTPSRGLLYAVLTSYAEKEDGLWHLRPEDSASARRGALQEMRKRLETLANRLGYRSKWVDEATLHWLEGEEVQVLLRLQASAQTGWLARVSAAPRRILVLPASRVGLLLYKSQRDPRLADALFKWEILKFRHLRLLEEIPLLTRQTFDEQLRLDPPAHSASQMMLF
ncbi:MAG: hypothetical protein ACK4VW_09030 [Anaerolineales bacterium]